MKEKVLVTGAKGFIGSHLVDMLLEKGYDVIATDLDTAPDDFLNPGAVFIPGDLSSLRDMTYLFSHEEMQGVETMFHLGAVFDFFPSWDVMYNNNVNGTRNICEAFSFLLGKKKRFILFSSGVVSSDILRASNYGRSKAGQERVVRESFWDKFETVIVRPAAVIGPRSRYGAAKIVEMVADGQMQFYVGKKNLIDSSVHVADVVRAVIHIAETPFAKLKEVTGLDTPIFDLVDDLTSYEELLDFLGLLLKETHGARILPIHVPVWFVKFFAKWQEYLARKFNTRPKLPVDMLDFFIAEMKMDTSPVKKLGFKFNYPDTKKSIEDTVNWYLGEGWI